MLGRIVLFCIIILVMVTMTSYGAARVKKAVEINRTRGEEIMELIRKKPGIHFRGIMEELDLRPGVTSYHINRFEKKEIIKSFQDGMYRKFYLYDDRVENRISLTDLQRLIIDIIHDEPGISQIDISRAIGKSKVVINYHVKFLMELGLLDIERNGRSTSCFISRRFNETIDL